MLVFDASPFMEAENVTSFHCLGSLGAVCWFLALPAFVCVLVWVLSLNETIKMILSNVLFFTPYGVYIMRLKSFGALFKMIVF